MKVTFQYNKERDIWCLLNKGKSSNNSNLPTKQYEQLVASYGVNPSVEATSAFIGKYLLDHQINLPEYVARYQKDWDGVAGEYQTRAEGIFGVAPPKDITGYLTINSRCPYNIEGNYFFVTVPTKPSNLTVMHELWHFYTWYGLGVDQEERVGKQKYNELKEALTAILNEECGDLLPEWVRDVGYPQHQELRGEMVEFWKKDKDIKKLWEHFVKK